MADAEWQETLAALRAYAAAHGALPPAGHPSGLGAWVGNQRSGKRAMDAGRSGGRRRGMTPARAAALEGVPGWTWGRRGRDDPAAWEERLAELKAHVAAHGRLPTRGRDKGLSVWVDNQRRAKRAADAGQPCARWAAVTPARVAALEAVPGWTWDGSRSRKRRREAPAAGGDGV